MSRTDSEPTSQEVVLGHLDQRDLEPIGVAQPELQQAPRHPRGAPVDRQAEVLEAALFDLEVGDLKLQLRRSRLGSSARCGELEVPPAEEVHRADHPAAVAVFVVEPEAQHVLVEVARRGEVPGMENEA